MVATTEFSIYQVCPGCQGEMALDDSDTRPIAGQWWGSVVYWARFCCPCGTAVEYNEGEGYTVVEGQA